ncbi:hypothetical protein JOD45_002801 [Scopulibacillus daqui]|uniref:WD40 repeat protein n=1 Tax=Scopulibacillus daqui TaxID=1469162 RepID=A0ABS2Q2Y2_9BACL|nr:hypothetical protein [Scopulibacillus daqui]MBM7646571.1 hypothetical protein [Scopulibacillus daqui]
MRLHKRTTIFIMIAFAVFIVILFFLYQRNDSSVTAQKSASHDDQKLLTVFTDAQLDTSYYLFNGDNQLIDKRKMTDYPSAALGKNHLYFTSKDSENFTQLYQLNLKTKTKKQLSHKFLYVDNLHLDNVHSRLYMRVVLPHHQNFQIAVYDLKKGAFYVLDPKEKDNSVAYFDYNPSKDKLLVLNFSVREDYKNTDEANKKGKPPLPATMHLNLLAGDGKKIKEILAVKKSIQDVSMSPSGNEALFTASSSSGNTEKSTIYKVDLKTGQKYPIISDNHEFTLLKQSLAQYANDENSIYFLAVSKNARLIQDEGGREAKERAIYCYNLKTKEIKQVWHKKGGIINNFSVIR